MNLKEIVQIFEENRNEIYGAKMSAYLKNHFICYGIKSPLRKELTKEVLKKVKTESLEDVIIFVDKLFQQPYRELHYLAMEMLDKKKKELTAEHLDFAESLILRNSWWDTVDYISTHIFCSILQKMNVEDRKDYSLKLSVHENMWMNRVGIIYQLPLKMETNVEILELSILPHIDSKEFFLKKAIGWALRQYGKYNPSYVIGFLEKYELQNLSIREASKYL